MDTSAIIRIACGTVLAAGAVYATYKGYTWLSNIMRRVEVGKRIIDNKLIVYAAVMRYDDVTVAKIMTTLSELDALINRMEVDHFSVTDAELMNALETSIELAHLYAQGPVIIAQL